jgi:hypothetical protein
MQQLTFDPQNGLGLAAGTPPSQPGTNDSPSLIAMLGRSHHLVRPAACVVLWE